MSNRKKTIKKYALGGEPPKKRALNRMENSFITPDIANIKKYSDDELHQMLARNKQVLDTYQKETQALDSGNVEMYRRLLANRPVTNPQLLQTARESTAIAPTLINTSQMKDGGIYIKPSKKGTFTAAATKHNMGVQEFARKVLANKDKYSSKMIKKATFASNSSKWQKELGGEYLELGGFLQNISPLISTIPGAAPIGMATNLAGNIIDMVQDKGSKRAFALEQMINGGDFKQYTAPTHADGGMLIDANGNPASTRAVAEVEKDENSYKGYVYSDHLVNPDTGKTFAKDAKRIARQTKRDDAVSKTSRILQLMKLRQSNDMARAIKEGGQDINPQGVPMAKDGLRVNPELDPLPTRGGVEYKHPFPYNYDMITETSPVSDNFYTVTGDNLPAPVPTTPPVEKQGLSTLNKVAAGLKGASLAFGAYDALRGSEQEKLQLPNYSRGDEYYRGLEVDLAPALGEINMAATKGIQDVSNQASGIGARNSRVNAILARAGKSAAQTQLQQQQANAGIRAQIGSREDMKSQTVAGERIRQQIAQSQNDATNRLAGRKFFSDLSQVGTSLNSIQYMNDAMKNQNELGQQAIKYGLSMLSQKYPNFKPSPEFLERLRTSSLTTEDQPIVDELVKFYGGK